MVTGIVTEAEVGGTPIGICTVIEDLIRNILDNEVITLAMHIPILTDIEDSMAMAMAMAMAMVVRMHMLLEHTINLPTNTSASTSSS